MTELLAPDRCAMCFRAIRHGEQVCPKCRADAELLTGERCKSCGAPVKDCACSGRSRFYDSLTAPFYYRGSARRGMTGWKFGGRLFATEFWASAMAYSFGESSEDAKPDFICFVPQTDKEQTRRGFNQAKLLAETVGVFLGAPVLPALKKLYETGKQHDLPALLRTGNVFGVFDVAVPVEEGARVLLVDDISTTGTSLNECAKMLKLAGAERVDCLTAAVARTPEKKKEKKNGRDT